MLKIDNLHVRINGRDILQGLSLEVKHPSAIVEHEATTSKISDDQMFYCRSRGISQEDAVSLIVDGFCKQVFRELPMEFAVEAKKLLEVSLEGAIG